MTLAEFLAEPLPGSATLQTMAIVFDSALAQKMLNCHHWYGDPRYTVFPAATADGRWFHVADILLQCVHSGGMYAAGFARLNSQNFVNVNVVPLVDVQTPEESPPRLVPEPGPPMDELA
jgi:hypothetical protein